MRGSPSRLILEAVDGGGAGFGGHAVGGDDLAALAEDGFGEVVDFGVGEVVEGDAAGGSVDTAGDFAVGLDEEALDEAGDGGVGDCGEVAAALPLGVGLAELLDRDASRSR